MRSLALLPSTPECALRFFLTAKTHRHERLQGLSAGADDFLAKPIDHCELNIAMKTAHSESSPRRRRSLRAPASSSGRIKILSAWRSMTS